MEKNSKPIAEYMSPAPVCVQLDADLATAVQLMELHGIRHLPVLDAAQLVGIVSERDLAVVETLVPNDWERFPVAEAMTTAPYVVPPDAPLYEVARVMADHKYATQSMERMRSCSSRTTHESSCRSSGDSAAMPVAFGDCVTPHEERLANTRGRAW